MPQHRQVSAEMPLALAASLSADKGEGDNPEAH